MKDCVVGAWCGVSAGGSRLAQALIEIEVYSPPSDPPTSLCAAGFACNVRKLLEKSRILSCRDSERCEVIMEVIEDRERVWYARSMVGFLCSMPT